MVNPFAPYLSIINFAPEPILKIGFAIVVAGIVMVALATTRSGLAAGWVEQTVRSFIPGIRDAPDPDFCVAVSPAAACVVVVGGAAAQDANDSDLDRNEHVRRR